MVDLYKWVIEFPCGLKIFSKFSEGFEEIWSRIIKFRAR